MIFFGDITPGQFFGSCVILTADMPTAIARMYSKEGFAVAADGRGSRADGRGSNIENAQKIFPINDAEKSLAYTFAGMVQFFSEDNPDKSVFDFVTETEKAVRSVGIGTASSAVEFVQQLCVPLEAKLRSVVTANGGAAFPTNEPIAERPGVYQIAHIFFDGYFQGIPRQMLATFLHQNQCLLKTETSWNTPVPNVLSGYGSKIVFDLVGGREDGWAASYRTQPREPQALSLKEAETSVRNYVAACCDSRAMEVDPEHCWAIGGHIHIATITKSDGFKWVQEPIRR